MVSSTRSGANLASRLLAVVHSVSWFARSAVATVVLLIGVSSAHAGCWLVDSDNGFNIWNCASPLVSWQAPANGSVVTSGASVTLTANAQPDPADESGAGLIRVEFLVGSTIIGTAVPPAFGGSVSINWTPPGAGAYTIRVRSIGEPGVRGLGHPTNGQPMSSVEQSISIRVNSPPGVTLTSPSPGAVLNGPTAGLRLSANASDADGSVARVEFLANGSLVGTSSTAPYQFDWNGISSGSYAIVARAVDNDGVATTTAAATFRVNTLPAVSATSSAASGVAPASFTLNASASDSDGSISLVEFLVNGTVVGSRTTAPFTFAWSGVGAGSYSYTARATDNNGQQTTSAPVAIIVNAPPVVSVSAPVNGAVVQGTGNSVLVAASASDSDGSISRVEFFANGTAIGTATSTPFQFTWTGVGVGTYTVFARATDNAGAVTDSAPITLTVNALPSVALTQPANGAVVQGAGQTVLLAANASDSDGSISRVDFLSGATVVGSATSAPFQFNWVGVAVGTYSLTARATDNRGGVTTSAPITLVVNTPPSVALTSPASTLVLQGAGSSLTLSANASDSDGAVSQVQFLANGSVVGTATASPFQVTWSNIPSGSYTVAARATDNRGAVSESTGVSVRVNALPNVALTAPTAGTVVDAPASMSLAATVSDADGTIAKVDYFANGTLIATSNAAPFSAAWNNVSAGTYSITAIATDNSGGTATSAAVSVIVNARPTVTLTSPAANASARAPASQTLSATATDSDGSIASVEFLVNGVVLATDTTAPYAFDWANIPAGTYSIIARATDNRGATSTTSATTLTVSANAAPSVSLTAPTSGASFAFPASITLRATASDSDGTVAKVDFYAGSSRIGQGTLSAGVYSLTWANDAPGSYTVFARATDNEGLERDSAAINVTITGAPADTQPPPGPGGNTVGTLPGDVTVSPSGAAKYDITLPLPPGTAGVVPSLALSYSSQGGDSILGYGWNLTGFSSIQRCGKTKATDVTGTAGASALGTSNRIRVNLNASDEFCLDGQRLVLVSGTHGANATYRTEIDSFSRISSFGTNTAKGPDRWEVWTKSGLIIDYGATADSLLEASGRSPTVVMTWAANRARDRRNNFYTISYLKNAASGELYPSVIRYTGNSSATGGFSPYHAVRFIYDATDRVDPQEGFVAGSIVSSKKRLNTIRVVMDTAADGTGGVDVREFRLRYRSNPVNGRALVEQIQDCARQQVSASSPYDCMPASTFEYSQRTAQDNHFNAPGSGDWAGPDLRLTSLERTSFNDIPFNGGIEKVNSAKFADFDGDGRTDVAVAFNEGTWRVCLSTGSAFACQDWAAPGATSQAITGDFNGDGATDFIWTPPGSQTGSTVTWKLCLSTRSGFTCSDWVGPNIPFLVGDLDADGRDDLYGNIGAGSFVRCLSTGVSFSCGPWAGSTTDLFAATTRGVILDTTEFGDPYARQSGIEGRFDGTGRPGVLYANGNTYAGPVELKYCALNEAGAVCQPVASPITQEPMIFAAPMGPQSAQLNHDGADAYSDILVGFDGPLTGGETCQVVNGFVFCRPNRGPVQMQLCSSTGNGLSCRRQPTSPQANDYNLNVVSDVDGDGRPDTLNIFGGRVCQVGRPDARCDTYSLDLPAVRYVTRTGDFNGDGRVDVAVHSRATDTWRVLLAGGATPDLLIKVTNGVGHVTQVEYDTLRNPSVYTRDTNAMYPQRDVLDGSVVVKEVKRDAGLGSGTMFSTTYRYGGAKIDLTGRGFLGYRWYEAYDAVTKVRTRTEMSQTFPYIGMPTLVSGIHVPTGVEIKRVSTTYANRVTANATGTNPRIWFPYADSSTETTREINSGAVISQTTINGIVVNDFGMEESRTSTSVAGGQSFSETVTATYRHDVANWLIGLMETQRTTRTAPGFANVTRARDFTYTTLGELESEITEKDDTTGTMRLTVTLGRDPVSGMPTSRQNAWTELSVSPAVTAWTEDGKAATRTVETLGYDTRWRFATTLRNAKSHLATRAFDARTGKATSSIDVNQLTTSWQFDGFGRVVRETRPDGTYTTTTYTACSTGCGTARIQTTTQSFNSANTAISPATTTQVDVLMRPVRWLSLAFDGRQRLAEQEYDVNGRLARKARSRFAGDAPVWVSYSYDDLGRVRSTTGPNGTATVAHDGLRTVFTNEKNQTRTEVRNALGKLRTVTDARSKTTTFDYEPFGNVAKVTDPLGNEVTVQYDRQGRKTRMADPNLGTWTYVTNALGQLRQQTDARGQVVRMRYETLGRIQQRLASGLDANWVYDTGTKAVGQLNEAFTLTGTGTKDYQRLHTFDSLGRPLQTTVRTDIDYITVNSYDTSGRASQTSFRRVPRGGGTGVNIDVQYTYNSLGYMDSMRNGSTVLWQVNKQDALNRIERETFPNGIVVRRDFRSDDARLERIVAGKLAAGEPDGTVQNDFYRYDPLGNVELRTMLNGSGGTLSESFGYDELNRITSSTIGTTLRSFTYDDIGNLRTKTGVGTLNYPVPGPGVMRPHAVTSITGTVAGITNPSFSYDANGNLLTGMGRTVTWNGSNLPDSLTKAAGAGPGSAGTGSVTDTFVYGPELQRVRQTVTITGGPTPGTTNFWYGGPIEKETRTADNTTHVRVFLPNGVVIIDRYASATATVTSATGSTRQFRYYMKDRLGSTTAVTDQTGAVLERQFYDVWGKRRNADGSENELLRSLDHRMGYTGHEHMDPLGLIHMNGRIYEPLLGRFMSGDPKVPDPTDGQNYNRYSYVLNNPLVFTDPSGFSQVREVDLPSNLTGRFGAESEFGPGGFALRRGLEEEVNNFACDINPLSCGRSQSGAGCSINPSQPRCYATNADSASDAKEGNSGKPGFFLFRGWLYLLTEDGTYLRADAGSLKVDHTKVTVSWTKLSEAQADAEGVGGRSPAMRALSEAPGIWWEASSYLPSPRMLLSKPALHLGKAVFGPKMMASEARATSAANSKEAKTLYHYTDAAGAKGIAESGVIRPDAKGRVFVTDQKLSPTEVKDTLFIGRSGEKGSHVVEIQPAQGMATRQGKNPNELIHQGSIRDGRQATLTVRRNE